jgi:hypothetical protein
MLHADDVRALSFAFDPNDDAEDREHKISDALGLDLIPIRALAGAMVADLRYPDHTALPPGPEPVDVDESSFGIAWWHGYRALGTARRLLVGDYLIEVVDAIETNLLEARLHLSSMRAALTADVDPRLAPPLEYLTSSIAQLHMAGMLRAVLSAVDCVGAATIGVLGLRVRLKRSDFGDLPAWLERHARFPALRGRELQIHTAREVVAAFEQRAPAGWLRWATAARNTFVHRGRRHNLWHPQLGLRLPAEPERSGLEAFLSSLFPESLHESCEETLAGIMPNANAAIIAACTALCVAWGARRQEPGLIEQPREQWPDDPPIDAGASFAGFAPKDAAHTPVMVINPRSAKRWAAVAADRRLKHLWRTFT